MGTLIEQIRQLEGYENFLKLPTFKDVQIATRYTPLVYIVATPAGGLALIVRSLEEKPEKPVARVWLPELTDAALKEQLAHYLNVYSNRKKDQQAWKDALENIAHWLWQTVMERLLLKLAGDTQVTLILVGRLGLLPLHAAWTEVNNTPTGKRYALDCLTISYTPNARSLISARNIANRVLPDTILAIQEPKPQPETVEPLLYSKYEVQQVVSHFSANKRRILEKPEETTSQTVLSTILSKNDTVLHFSCHGVANLNKPLESGLIMANNEHLTVKDFLELRLNGVRLATLSACETGMPGMDLPDEVVNLPAGLLQAGVAGVVASLWSVSDMSTALLMTKFYQEVITLWQQQGTQASIAPALQKAQCWLRDATKEELAQWVKELPMLKKFGYFQMANFVRKT
ncbi:MAG: hypothetical protein DRR19_19590 [Candidatus Parabeggiatoa sp. nov. 1]|nr:MAG: hypothetical protein DRR19_19590 [Gammaproteobacteria bacterium]